MCALSGTAKMTFREPALPRIPPQLHHVFTTTNSLESQKASIKRTLRHLKFFPAKIVESKHGN
jgi:hypothetical protein